MLASGGGEQVVAEVKRGGLPKRKACCWGGREGGGKSPKGRLKRNLVKKENGKKHAEERKCSR